MTRTDDREFTGVDEGTVFIWDIDKTYLATKTKTVVDLLRTAFEFAIDKRELNGTVPLLHGIRRGRQNDGWLVPLYFVSASPSQMRDVLERKMLLDGVEPDGITLKRQVSVLFSMGPSALRRQVGYKLSALLMYRLDRPVGFEEILFGDDSESDPLVYSLYTSLVDGSADEGDMRRVLEEAGEPAQVIDAIAKLLERLTRGGNVRGIFIQMTSSAIPRNSDFRSEVIFIRHPLQSALVLHDWGLVDDACVFEVGRGIRDETERQWILQDAKDRGFVKEKNRMEWQRKLV